MWTGMNMARTELRTGKKSPRSPFYGATNLELNKMLRKKAEQEVEAEVEEEQDEAEKRREEEEEEAAER